MIKNHEKIDLFSIKSSIKETSLYLGCDIEELLNKLTKIQNKINIKTALNKHFIIRISNLHFYILIFMIKSFMPNLGLCKNSIYHVPSCFSNFPLLDSHSSILIIVSLFGGCIHQHVKGIFHQIRYHQTYRERLSNYYQRY